MLKMVEEDCVGGTEGINWFNAFTHYMNKNQILPDKSFVLPIFREMSIAAIKNYIDSCNYPFNSDDVQKEYNVIKEKQNLEKPVLLITNYKENVKKFYERQPFFYDRNGLFWFWNKLNKCYERVDDTEILVSIEKEMTLTGDVISGLVKHAYLEAFRQVGRVNIPKTPQKTWIQFKNCVIDIETGKQFESNHLWFFCNSIPRNIIEDTETPQISYIFKEWVNTYDELLFEILAYSCIPDYPIHRLFVLIGSGSNGKSKFLELLTKFIGIKNITSANFEKLTENTFHSAKLYKKLVCIMGETNFNVLEKTDIIKRLTGQDLIDFEFKGKQGFEDYNYAKIIIATNSLPITADKTDGFYRRWVLIDFSNKFSEEKDILKNIPEKEYDALASKCIKILYKILKERKFSFEGTIEERKQRYEDKSNPLQKFLKEMTEQTYDGFIFKFQFEKDFLSWLEQNKYRKWSEDEIRKQMTKTYETGKKEYSHEKRYNAYIGISWKEVNFNKIPEKDNNFLQNNQFVKSVKSVKSVYIHPYRGGIESECVDRLDRLDIQEKLINENEQKDNKNDDFESCSDCLETGNLLNWKNNKNEPICYLCFLKVINGI